MPLRTKFGLGLAALGMSIAGACILWSRTRNFIPVDRPVSPLAGQSVTSSFTPNFDGLYLIQIEAQPAIPPDQLRCLLGVDADPRACGSAEAALGASWVLSTPGQDIRRGSTDEQHSAPTAGNTISREIGEFHGESGHVYTLVVTFTRDASALNATHPRLKVAISGIARSDMQAASVLAFSASFICILFGLTLLGIAIFAGSTSPEHVRSTERA
jgi:hypothetical protein